MDFKGFINYIITTLFTPLLSILLGAAVVFFLWNIFNIIRKSDQPEELAKMKERVLWGVIAITVMVSMWGLVSFLTVSFNLDTTDALDLERFNQPL